MAEKLKVHQVCGLWYDSNVYYLETKKPILIDTGTGLFHSKTLENLKKHGAMDKVSKIILTHNHADHSGDAAALSDELDAKVFGHELDARAVMEGNSEQTGAKMFGFEQKKVEVQLIDQGDTIDCGDIELEIIHTPGHSPGSITLYDSSTKSMFCGDLVFMDGGVGRWDLPGGDYKLLVKSFEKVLELDIENFYPGHGPANEGSAMKYIKMSYEYLKSCAAFA